MGAFDNPNASVGKYLTAARVASGERDLVVSGFSVEGFDDGNRIVVRGTINKKPAEFVLSPSNAKFVRSYLAGMGIAEEALHGATFHLSTRAVMFRNQMTQSIVLSGITPVGPPNAPKQ